MTIDEVIEYWEGLRKTFSSQLEREENHFGRMHLQTTIDALDTTISALRAQQERNDWVCTLKCKALMDEGTCAHGGLCCLYESQRVIEENTPLTLDELRQMDGEPVWLNVAGGVFGLVDTSDFVAWLDRGGFIALDMLSGKVYRRKPEEGTV